MKKIFTIGLALALAVGAFAQVNLWRRNGYLSQFDKATLDSITLTMADPYDEYRSYHIPFSDFTDITDDPLHLSVQTAYDYQKKAYVGLGNMGYGRHNDFGFAAICMFLDSRGQDFIGPNINYNWFGVWGDPANWRDNTLKTTTGLVDHLIWRTLYKAIGACNYVIATHTSGSEADKYEVAQAKAVRAFEYMQLAQAYQVAYSESSLSLPCVPLITDTMCFYLILNQPVATVAQVYAQIKKDLDEAISGLQGFQRADKSAVNRAVAFGLRARYNLLTHNYEQAASDAEQALLLSGATPLTIAQASVPGFTSAEAQNVLWANIISESDDVVQTGIVNWPSHMSTFYLDGYANYASPRSIASALYDEIPATDVRKGWWLDASGNSPLLDAEGYSELKDQLSQKNPYVNVKFGTGDGTGSGTGAAAADWIVMRAEELILLRAEALERAGKNGAAVLKDFMKNYRDPSYDIDAHGLTVADEIWWQRRVELWGEGFAFGDLMRLHKPVVRTTSTNWPWAQDVAAGDERFPLAIPEKDPEYKVLAVWRNGVDDLYKSYYLTLSNVDSITLGEAKEINDVRFGYADARNGIKRIYHTDFSQPLQRSMKEEEMAAHPDTLTIGFGRNHNVREALTVPLIIEADSAFAHTVFPSEISFCGYYDTTCYSSYSAVIQIVVSNMPVGTHQFTITIPDEYAQGITDAKSFTYELTVKEPDQWDIAEVRTGVWVDQTIGPAFGLQATAWYVQYQVADQPDGSQKIRIINPYRCLPTGADAEGIYDGFPYNVDGDVDFSQDYNFLLNVAVDGEVRFPDIETFIGISWDSYTDMAFFDYAASKGNPGTYGRFEKEKSKIVFDAKDNTMIIELAGSLYGIQVNFQFYLSKAAYLADQTEPEGVDATVETYEGYWQINGLDVNAEEEVPVSANVTITSHTDSINGQYYTLEGLYTVMPVVYGYFDKKTHLFRLQASQGDSVDIKGTTYIPYLYMVNRNWQINGSITLDIARGEGDGLVTDENSEAIGFIIIYRNPADSEDYLFGDGMFDISFAAIDAASAPAHKAAKRPKSLSGHKMLMPKIGETAVKPLKKENKKALQLMTCE